MGHSLAAVSGKIQAQNGQCTADGRVVDCPQTTFSGLGGETTAGTKLDLLPPTLDAFDVRNDPLFAGAFIVIVGLVLVLAFGRVKLIGKTIGEYLRPIWWLIGITLLVVAWQYLVGVEQQSSHLALRISQWIWELAVAASAVVLARRYPDVTIGNFVVLGLLYSLIIHGTKVTIRYLFYHTTILYVADRFLYGSLLVLVVSVGVGFILIQLRKPSRTSGNVPVEK